MTIPDVGYYELGFLECFGFGCVEKRLMGYWRKWKVSQGHFLNIKILSNDVSNFKIKGMKS